MEPHRQEHALTGREVPREAGRTEEQAALDALTAAGINIAQGISYCGDQEGLREIIAMYHAQGAGRIKQLQQLFEEQNWKNYSITAHALKSNSRGIGANDLAELAFAMEMAGKENRPEYILEHHRELLGKYSALLQALEDNSFIYPEGYRNPEAEDTAEGKAGGQQPGDAQAADKAAAGIEIGRQEFTEQFGLLREKLDNFDAEGLEEILDRLASYIYQGMQFTEMTEQIRRSVEEFDFLAAAETLAEWEEKLAQDRKVEGI